MKKITDFQEKAVEKQEKMAAELSALKLEAIESLWFFVVGKDKGIIVGSKA